MVIGVLMVFTGCTGTEGPAQPIKITRTDEGFIVTEGEKKVLFYQREPKSLEGKYTRCHYIHPLYGLDDEILTEDFPSDHPHQRGIFWAWHQIWVGDKRVGDGWALEDFSWDVYNAEVLAVDSQSSALKLEVFWKSPLWADSKGRPKPFVRETTVIRVYRASEDIRMIDFQISLLALADDVRIGGSADEKGYGGFSARIRLPEGLRFTAQTGEVEPTNLSVEAGPWMDFSGNFQPEGQVSGLAILCYKSLPGYPQRWILRRQNSMQNPVYPGRQPVALSREKPLVLRYRLIVHTGGASQLKLDKLQSQYNKEINR